MWNRPFSLLLLTNILLGSAMPMLIILGGLAGAQLAPVKSLVTLAMSVQMIAGIVVATPLSLMMGKTGRKIGFLIVSGVCVAGGLIGALAMQSSNFWLLCLAHFVLGCALVGVNFIRFAVTEVVPAAAKANALSITLASGLIAALVGPSIFEHTQQRFIAAEFGGAYLAISVLGLLAVLPMLLSRNIGIAVKHIGGSSQKSTASMLRVFAKRPALRIAIIVAAVSQAIMVLMMVPTPLAMVDHGHMTHHASDVIRWHVIAMFAPGLFAGTLIGHFGVFKVMTSGLLLLMVAGLVGLVGTTLFGFYGALILLGLGWNFGFIGATHLLQSSIDESEKSAIQGINDTVIAICSSVASVIAGALYVNVGWATISASVLPVLIVCAATVIWIMREK